MKKKYKVLLILLITFLSLSIFIIEIKGHKTSRVIAEFISRAEFVKVENKTAYYKVVKKYDYENTENIIDSLADEYIGTTGDIYISAKDPLDFFVSKYISKKLRIGHAAIVKSEDATITVEVTGNTGKENNIVKEYDNIWFKKSNVEISVLRVKGVKQAEKEKITDWLEKHYGNPYSSNYFKHSNNKFYCLDLCSEAYKSIGYEIDGGANTTLGSTIINNDNTYIIYYKKKVNKENINYEVYYLSEE